MLRPSERPIVILGGGLTGISTAYHLGRPWLLFEREDRLGGHARTEQRDGFSFDRTGHWLHLRDPSMRALVDRLLPDGLVTVERKARIFSHGALTRYPFQANLHGLPPAVIAECLLGFLAAREARPEGPPRHFEDFILRHFGEGIARHFMIPYNQKLWGVPPREITSAWCSRFVPIPRLEEVIAGAVGAGPPELGYNVSFLYPRSGGIETLTRALVAELDPARVHTGADPEAIDPRRRELLLGGERIGYDALVATLPLPELCRRLVDPPPEIEAAAARLRCTPVRYLNVAVRRPVPADFHWLYVPEERYPFYRVGVYTNAAPAMAPPGLGSLYVELSDRSARPLEALLPDVLAGLVAAGALASPDDLLFCDLRELQYAYVVFDDHYYEATARLTAWLEERRIFPRGRYGAWTYNSMEDCLLAGRDVARALSPSAAA